MMKNSNPHPSKTTMATTATSTNTNPNASTNAPDDHGGDDVEVGITNTNTSVEAPDDDDDVKVGVSSSIASDAPPRREWRSSMDEYNRKVAGDTSSASATAPSSSAPPDAPTRERGFQGKSSSAKGQDVSRPGAFHVGVEAGSSSAPTGEQGFNKDEYRRHRPGQTTSAAAPSSSVTSDVPATRDWRSSRDAYNRKVAGDTSSASATAPSSSVPSDAPTRERGFQGKSSSAPGQDVSRPGAFHVGVEAGSSNAPTGEQGFNKDEYRRHRPGQNSSAAAPSSSDTSDVPSTRDWRSSRDAYDCKVAGETASASVPSSLAPPDAPTRARGFGIGESRGKSSSTPGQDVSRPGAFHDGGAEAGSSGAPTREQGFNKDDYRRHRPGQTTSAAAPSSSLTSDVPATRDWRSSRAEHDRKVAGETASATASSSLAPPDAPTRERGFGLGESQGKLSSSAREDQEPDEFYSQPGALRVAETLGRTLGDGERVTTLPPVLEPEIHQSRENVQGEYLAEASLVLEPDLVFGEPLEEPPAYWSQRKVQRRALCLSLLVLGAVAGAVVGVVVLVGGGSTSASSIFDCSNTTVGCRYTGKKSLGFQDPATFLIANCNDTNFEIPTKDNCDCEVNVPTSTPEGFESCQTCSFVDSADGEWRLAYDCSNLLSGDCVGRDTSNNCISRRRFDTTSELRDAVDDYLADNSTNTLVASIYGSPIGDWDVSTIQDFSYLFSADESVYSERFNLAAANFNEDISGWEVSSATTMTSMFAGARSFDQPIGSWNVSSVRDTSFMFSRALSFDQPLGDWNVSRVTDMSNTFYSATSFNQKLGDWDMSSVRDMSYMFAYAASLNRSYADWNVSNETDMHGIFTGADVQVQLQLQVQYDYYPVETGWTLRDSTGTLISSQATGSFTALIGTVTSTSSVALGTYTFEMTDTNGDGICCVYGNGSFSIAVNGETLVSSNGQFADIVQETFEVRAPTPSRRLAFDTASELRSAVDLYLADNRTNTLVARTYGMPLGVWDVSKIQDFSFLFAASDFNNSVRSNPVAAKFNEDIAGWDVSGATTMFSMFYGATSFNKPLADWNVSSVTDMAAMFATASSFNQPLAEWNVSSVADMSSMFYLATSFDQPLAEWNVSSVKTTYAMFNRATSFNQPLPDWNVSIVTSMREMFEYATSFNQPLAAWNVSSVTDMRSLFDSASAFNQSLGNWDVSSETDLTGIFRRSDCPVVEGEESCFYNI